MAEEFKVDGASVTFWLKVKPRSGRERLQVDSAGELRLELHAPPIDGQANEACVSFFAKALHLPRSCVAILSGQKARRKLLRLTGQSGEELIVRLQDLAGLNKVEGSKRET